MEPAEAVSRIADVGRHAALRASLRYLASRSPTAINPEFWLEAPDVENGLDQVSAKTREAVISAASRWLEHRASFLSLQDVWLGEQINWHRDYSSDVKAPLKYAGLINPREANTVGNVKYIWELNRLQHLVPLALAWHWTRNVEYVGEVERQLGSWQKSNPFMMGVNWKSALEVGLRLVSWAYVDFLVPSWSRDRKRSGWFAQMVYHHQYFIRKFFSKYSSANNHLIGEMAGLYVASVFWPWYTESTAWRSFARRKLIEEILRQVEPDGVGKERACEYQLFILELFLLAGALGQKVGDPFPPVYWERISRMARFLSVISNRNGVLPMFGDGDNSQAIALPETVQDRFRALAGIERGDENGVGRDLRATLLLWGQSRSEIPLHPAPEGTAQRLQEFRDGGYWVLADDRGCESEILVVFDVAPLGFAPLCAHGHADALSFCLSFGGREFLIDPGTYSYDGMSEWRSFFRGTGAHNTVRIDGQDQSVAGGPFLWRQAARCRIEHKAQTDEFVEICGSHDGYCRLRDPVGHTRTLRLEKRSRALLILDDLHCRGSHHVELLFHFSDQCQLAQTGSGSFEASNGARRLAFHVESRLRTEIYRGCEYPIFGWVSRTFGAKQPAFTLVCRAEITGPAQFLTEISPA